MTVQSTPSDLAAWVLDHGVGLTPARQKQLAKGYRRLEAQTDIRGRAVVMYRDRARQAEAERDEWRQTALDERAAALDALDQIKAREARIKAVQDVLDEWAVIDPDKLNVRGARSALADIRRALDGDA